MTGLEELTRKGYLRNVDRGTSHLSPDKFGRFGRLELGDTTFNVLRKFLDIDIVGADDFVPLHYQKPANIGLAKPDELIVSGRSIEAVVEYK